jgi:hypothetical protein
MTEDEAKTKWCPFARVYDESAAANRACIEASPIEEEDLQNKTRCLASGCMAWRTDGGYCGLAGAMVR